MSHSSIRTTKAKVFLEHVILNTQILNLLLHCQPVLTCRMLQLLGTTRSMSPFSVSSCIGGLVNEISMIN
jgi:hypothetical protein